MATIRRRASLVVERLSSGARGFCREHIMPWLMMRPMCGRLRGAGLGAVVFEAGVYFRLPEPVARCVL